MSNEIKIASDFRCGYVAIIGEPNVGKSTLMNSLIGQKLSIVTPKAQTTRHKIFGILSTDEYQIIFLDTPGIIKPKYLMQEVMMESASSAIQDADVVVMMSDATKTEFDPTSVMKYPEFEKSKKPVIMAINKVDAVEKRMLLPMIDSFAKLLSFKEIIPLSALQRDGTAELVNAIVKLLPVHAPFYPLDVVSEQNERFFVSEIIREKIFFSVHEEIPYSTTVDIVEFKEREKGKTFISANIYVERDSQKGILIGKRGAMLKRIGALARKEIETFLGHFVYLDLHVRMMKEWRDDKAALARLGYRKE